MARPFPWLPRLANIRRSVSNSQRSHYGRRDLELLFGVSQSAAGRLLALIATEPFGTAHMVARDRLAGFLEAVSEADDVPALCENIRAKKGNLTRVKSRYIWLRDDAEVPFDSLPAAIKLEPGRLEICFESPEVLLGHLAMLTSAIRDDLEAFERTCELRPPEESAEAAEARWYKEEIARMDAVLGTGKRAAA